MEPKTDQTPAPVEMPAQRKALGVCRACHLRPAQESDVFCEGCIAKFPVAILAALEPWLYKELEPASEYLARLRDGSELRFFAAYINSPDSDFLTLFTDRADLNEIGEVEVRLPEIAWCAEIFGAAK